jgi:hypothetical protein
MVEELAPEKQVVHISSRKEVIYEGADVPMSMFGGN